jgi:hypothetical protein
MTIMIIIIIIKRMKITKCIKDQYSQMCGTKSVNKQTHSYDNILILHYVMLFLTRIFNSIILNPKLSK